MNFTLIARESLIHASRLARAFGLSATDLLAMCESELPHRTAEKSYRSGDFKFRQVKYAVTGATLGLVGGYLDPGEEPLAAARRELLEETGYEADDWTPLGRYAVDGNRGCGVGHLFLARGAREVAEPDADDLEEQELLMLTRAEVEAALLAGDFEVLSWAAAVALALVALDHA